MSIDKCSCNYKRESLKSDSMQIPSPKPEELVSTDKIKEYLSKPTTSFEGREGYTLDGALDNGSNALAMSTGAMRFISQGQEITDGMVLIGLRLVAPTKHNYQGLDEVYDSYDAWKRVRIAFQKIAKDDNSAIPVTKVTAHKAMNRAFLCFDPDPNNLKAKFYRDLLQTSAKILELQPLGIEPWLSALHEMEGRKKTGSLGYE